MKAENLACYIVERCVALKKPTNTIALQKMLYFINVRYMVYMNRPTPLFEETMIIGKWGALVRGVNKEFSLFGAMDITMLPCIYYIFYEQSDFEDSLKEKGMPLDVLNQWIDEYADWNRFDLVDLCQSHTQWQDNKDSLKKGVTTLEYDTEKLFREASNDEVAFFHRAQESRWF